MAHKKSTYDKIYDSSSLGDFSSKEPFGQAFKAAHKLGWSGHTFDYYGKRYTTDCKIGGDYGENSDNRSAFTHAIHKFGHAYNYNLKSYTNSSIETSFLGKFTKYARDEPWPKEVDAQRIMYHHFEIEKKYKS